MQNNVLNILWFLCTNTCNYSTTLSENDRENWVFKLLSREFGGSDWRYCFWSCDVAKKINSCHNPKDHFFLFHNIILFICKKTMKKYQHTNLQIWKSHNVNFFLCGCIFIHTHIDTCMYIYGDWNRCFTCYLTQTSIFIKKYTGTSIAALNCMSHGCQQSESMLGDFEEPITVPTFRQAV